MDEEKMQDYLEEAVWVLHQRMQERVREKDYLVKSIQTFEQVGLLTRNKGLVVTMKDGSAFQITIVPA